MSRPLDLFPSSRPQLLPAAGRTSPKIWVRRLVIWEDPEKRPIQDVVLRRGLNIVWSPDRRPDGTADLGHGAGKTLFCRLLRYCLGERTFANADIEVRVQRAFRSGLVGAEVVIDGVCWSVVRTIGYLNRSAASREAGLDTLLHRDDGEGFKAYVESLQAATLGPDQLTLLPDTRGNHPWLYALAALSRDQECRASGILQWRHKDSDTHSPVREREVSADTRLQALRVLLRAYSLEEQEIRASRASNAERRDELQATANSLQREVRRARREIALLLKVSESEVRGDEFARRRLEQVVKDEILRASQEALSINDTELNSWESLHAERVGEATVLRQRLQPLTAAVSLARARKKQLEEELIPAAQRLRDARYPKCPMTGTPIDRLKAAGCSIALPDEGLALQERDAIKADLKGESEQLARDETLLARMEGRLAELNSELESLAERIQRRRTALQSAQQAREDVWKAKTHLEIFYRRCAELLDVEDQAQQAAKADDDFAKQITVVREQHRDSVTVVGRWFDEVVGRLLGDGAQGSLTLDGNGLTAKVKAAGDRSTVAIEALKVLAFDIAVMFSSVCGQGSLPAFLVHDSPREADLSLDIYEELFKFTSSFEDGDDSPFQYIVTTTTPPPKEFQEERWLRLQLSGRMTRERLLRKDL